MKKLLVNLIGFIVGISLFIGVTVSADTPMYRLYNPNSGEHFYTSSTYERDSLGSIGWKKEGVGWLAPDSGNPVYRLYNPNARTGTHHYTLSGGERNSLASIGWRYEGVSWYAINDGAAYADASSFSNSNGGNSGKSLVGPNADGMVYVASGGNSDVYWYRIENMPSNTNFNNVVKMSEQTAISRGKHHSEKEKYN
ncbi:hypothetical protein [Streptococcus gallolyticus]|uniref:DUF5648 domain-containing protein n=1 Tax=Streptococcus gallolyticus TaxID=315405 RepID=A0A139R745_9STRE|nr:hypothetical protein SGADD03_00137 [Streptococcus gallolyticus]